MQQPYIVELAAIKLDDSTLKETERFEFLCHPGISIPEDAIKVHNITNEMVRSLPPFDKFLPELIDFFLGQRRIAAHNLPFDLNVLRWELTRRGLVIKFPWPTVHLCTVEASLPLKGYRLRLNELYQELTGKDRSTAAHRAMADVEVLAECIKVLRKKKML